MSKDENLDALKASLGRLMNAKFDLEAGATKATVIQRLGEYIALTKAAITKAEG